MNYVNQRLIRFWRKLKINKKLYFIILFAALIAIDQLSKYLIRHFGGFYICNTSIAWGIKIPSILFWIFWAAVITLLAFGLYKKYFIRNTLYITLIIAGATSNAIDRPYLGCVIDFINLRFWPVFNLADVFIVTGSFLLLAKYLKS